MCTVSLPNNDNNNYASIGEGAQIHCRPGEVQDIYHREEKQKREIAWCLCIPPLILETFSKIINMSTHSNMDITGLLKKWILVRG